MSFRSFLTFSRRELNKLYDVAVKDTVEGFEAAGSTVFTDGEQTKSSFATYPLSNITNLAPDGVEIPFDDGHVRQLPRLTEGPFRYGEFAGSYLPRLKKYTDRPVKQAVISASAISLLYPADGIEGYSQEEFTSDLIESAVEDMFPKRSRDSSNRLHRRSSGRKIGPLQGFAEKLRGSQQPGTVPLHTRRAEENWCACLSRWRP